MSNRFTRINVGPIDRALRIVLGLVLLSLTFLGPRTAWGWVGLVPLATGLFGMCPLYSILGVSTAPTPRVPAGRAHG